MEVTLMEMLEARDLRAARQQALLVQYRNAMVCFTMNIAGPIKNSPEIRQGFLLERRLLEEQLQVAGVRTLHFEEIQEHTRNETIYVLNVDPLAVKSLTVELEDHTTAGRLFDMDLFTFQASVAALWPYFAQCAETSMDTRSGPPEETFSRLRLLGTLAEGEIRHATAGANTRKGAISSMGILSGVRRQVEAGFPAVLHVGLPKLEAALAAGKSINEAGCAALLAMLAETVDSNRIHRGGYETQQEVAEAVSTLLEQELFPSEATLEALDRAFMERNLSPGGTADLLSLVYLLHFLKEEAHG